MGTETATDLDCDVLRILATRDHIVTYVIRNTLVMGNLCRKWRSELGTARVLRACLRLEARGHLEEVSSSYFVQKCWAITDAGRARIAALETEEPK